MKNYLKIENFIKDNVKNITSMKIKELANRIGVSISAITRFCKKKGYNGYQDIKEIFFSYSKSDYEFQKVISSISSTYKNLNMSKIKAIAKKIVAAERIYILGESFTYIQGIILERKLTRINIDARVLNVASDLSIILPKDKTAYIFISHSGKNINIKNAAEKIYNHKNNNKTIFSITAFPNNNIKNLSNEYLSAKTFLGQDFLDTQIPSTSFITSQIVIDHLYREVFNLNYDTNKKILENIAAFKIK